MWNGAGGPRGADRAFGGAPGGGRDRDRDPYRGLGARTGFDDTMRSCEEAVIEEAMDRLRPQVIVIRRTAGDDNPGRQDWIVGMFEVRRGREWDRYRFECSMNFSTGRVRSADFRTAGNR